MKKTRISLIVLSFGLALSLYLLDLTQFAYRVGELHVNIYPAAFFALLGAWLLVRAFMKKQTG
jgi:hypothetical protein